MRTKLKIVIHGGNVISVNDGQLHYLSPPTVSRLYGVNSCVSNIIEVEEYGNYSLFKLLFRR